MDIHTLRSSIDEIDIAIIHLIGKRMNICKQIISYKDKIEDADREAYLHTLWSKQAKGIGLSPLCTNTVLDALLAESKRIQSEL